MKALEVFATSFVAEFQSAEIAEPAERAFDDVTCLAQSAAVRLILPQWFQEGLDSQGLHHSGQRRAAVSRIALQYLGLDSGASAGSREASRRPSPASSGYHADWPA